MFGFAAFGQVAFGQGPALVIVETAILDLIAADAGLSLELVGASPSVLLDLEATVGIPVVLVGSHRGLTLDFEATNTVDLDLPASRGNNQ